MKNQLLLIGLGFALALALGCGRVSVAESEKTIYQGRPLGDWLEDYRQDEPTLQSEAQAVLDGLGPTDKAAVPALIKAAAQEESPRVRVTALQALARIGDAAARPVLVKAMNDRDPGVSRAAQRAYHRYEMGRAPRKTESKKAPEGDDEP